MYLINFLRLASILLITHSFPDIGFMSNTTYGKSRQNRIDQGLLLKPRPRDIIIIAVTARITWRWGPMPAATSAKNSVNVF